MHNGNWNGMDNGSWWWIPMMIMMIAFWGALIWIVVTLVRRGSNTPGSYTPGAAPSPTPRQAPHEILAERLARGEIEPDDYRLRLEALQAPPQG